MYTRTVVCRCSGEWWPGGVAWREIRSVVERYVGSVNGSVARSCSQGLRSVGVSEEGGQEGGLEVWPRSVVCRCIRGG